jgi:hypothetical protein
MLNGMNGCLVKFIIGDQLKISEFIMRNISPVDTGNDSIIFIHHLEFDDSDIFQEWKTNLKVNIHHSTIAPIPVSGIFNYSSSINRLFQKLTEREFGSHNNLEFHDLSEFQKYPNQCKWIYEFKFSEKYDFESLTVEDGEKSIFWHITRKDFEDNQMIKFDFSEHDGDKFIKLVNK